MNKETLQKLLKPPYIFILIGVVLLGFFLKSKNNESGEIEEVDSSGSNYDVFSGMENINSLNEIIGDIISENTTNMKILEDKLDTNVIQLGDLIRSTDSKLTEGLDDLKKDLDDRETTSITNKTTSSNASSSYITVGTWGKDPITKTTLSGIAKNAGITLDKLITLNPQYKNNPDLIKPGQKVRVS